MKPCDTCGNSNDKAFVITIGGTSHTFDSFECAIQRLAPRCAQCACKIIGHGVEVGGTFYCCAHCSTRGGSAGAVDRVA